jgi:hypothetical protein
MNLGKLKPRRVAAMTPGRRCFVFPPLIFLSNPTYSPFSVESTSSASGSIAFLEANPSAAFVQAPDPSRAIFRGGPVTCSTRSRCFSGRPETRSTSLRAVP